MFIGIILFPFLLLCFTILFLVLRFLFRKNEVAKKIFTILLGISLIFFAVIVYYLFRLIFG
ncbi:MAG: hypothetical protein COB15_01120 [Flavobacteriales bacterium]|nr:MAG: hypothetical protein COB15_01120 [Flavobacteriales bacterium]